MQREEKQIEVSLESIISRLTELKNQLHSLLFKIEHERETLSWPTVLDSFALISGQFSAISKTLSHDKIPPLRNLTVLPLYLSQDKDDDLLRLTEGRVPAFSHDLVPDYLRTKLEPEIEVKIQQFLHKANGLAVETAQKQMTTFNKVLNNVLDIVGKSRDEWESSSSSGIGQTSNLNDTHYLVSVISMGKDLKQQIPQGIPQPPPGMMVSPGIRAGPPGSSPIPPSGPQGSPVNMNQQMNMMGKGPTIRTNIKPGPPQMNQYR